METCKCTFSKFHQISNKTTKTQDVLDRHLKDFPWKISGKLWDFEAGFEAGLDKLWLMCKTLYFYQKALKNFCFYSEGNHRGNTWHEIFTRLSSRLATMEAKRLSPASSEMRKMYSGAVTWLDRWVRPVETRKRWWDRSETRERNLVTEPRPEDLSPVDSITPFYRMSGILLYWHYKPLVNWCMQRSRSCRSISLKQSEYEHADVLYGIDIWHIMFINVAIVLLF